MSQYVPLQLRREVRQRAGQHCEYCLLHEDDALLPHEPDHIIALQRCKTFWTNTSENSALLVGLVQAIEFIRAG